MANDWPVVRTLQFQEYVSPLSPFQSHLLPLSNGWIKTTLVKLKNPRQCGIM